MKHTLEYLYLVTTALIFPFFSHADSNGVIRIYPDDMHADPIVINPAEPYAFENFSIEYHVTDVYSVTESVFVDITSNEITVEFMNGPPPNPPLPPGQVSALRTELTGLPAGEYTVRTLKRIAADDENPSNVIHHELSLSILETYPTQLAYAFYIPYINHYFVTTDLEEMEEQPGFISDRGFNVWPAEGPAPESAQPVCRFYSHLVNSHFYTASEEECAMLQEEGTGWEYEGIAFQALIPSDGACPSGTTPVWRLYNNRAAELDSNHRFVASQETYRIMKTDGWLGEGVAFCSPPASVEE